jgi:hypothetical protein
VTRVLTLAEYGAGAVIALATAIPIHWLVHRVGTSCSRCCSAARSAWRCTCCSASRWAPIGMFQVMLAGSLIGMYGGMLFAMRDAMQPASWTQTVVVAIVFGALVVGASARRTSTSTW